MNTSKLRNHERIPDYNSSNTLGLQEREMLMQLFGPQERLDYPTEILKMSNGCEVEKYIIPESDRQKVLDALYPFFQTIGRTAEIIESERLQQIIDGIDLKALDGILGIGCSKHHEGWRGQRLHEIHTIQVGHVDVTEDGINYLVV